MEHTSQVLRRAVRNTFWDAYEHMGPLVLVNVLWVVCSAPLVTLPLTTAGVLCFTYEIVVGRDARLRDFFAGAVRLWKPALILMAGTLALLAMAGGNVAFYMKIAREYPMIGVALAGVCFWVTLGVMMALQFVVPAAVELWLADDAEHRERIAWLPQPPVVHARQLGIDAPARSVKAAVKAGFVVFLQAPGVAVLSLAGLILFTGICGGVAVGFVLFWPGVTCLFCHHLYGETVAQLAGLGDRRAEEYRREKG